MSLGMSSLAASTTRACSGQWLADRENGGPPCSMRASRIDEISEGTSREDEVVSESSIDLPGHDIES